jgi:hypothetical protein
MALIKISYFVCMGAVAKIDEKISNNNSNASLGRPFKKSNLHGALLRNPSSAHLNVLASTRLQLL